MIDIENLRAEYGCFGVGGIPGGYDGLFLSALAGRHRQILYVLRDESRMLRAAKGIAFVDPTLPVRVFPAWDNLPFDRVSPHPENLSRRMDVLTDLLKDSADGVVVTTVSAFLQRVPPRAALQEASFQVKVGDHQPMAWLVERLARSGYDRVGTVMEPGEFCVRGGIIDLFPPGMEYPVRMDYFGDDVDSLRHFNPEDQRGTDKIEQLTVKPVNEVFLDERSISRFRQNYQAAFGKAKSDDLLYQSVTEGQRVAGMEHFLPLFHDKLDTLLDYLPDAAICLDHQLIEARDARFEQISEHLASRQEVIEAGLGGGSWPNLSPERLYMDEGEWHDRLARRHVLQFSPFQGPDDFDAGGGPGLDFSVARADPNINLYDHLVERLNSQRAANTRILIAAWSQGSRDRLVSLITDHGLRDVVNVESWRAFQDLKPGAVACAVLEVEQGFSGNGFLVVTEQDILGDRLVRPSRRRMRAENFISEASSLSEGDLVVHLDHGIGRYEGLEAIDVSGAPHDCLRVVYDGGDKLFVPVENIEILSRYGSDQGTAKLDRLGGVAWQSRKARLKERVREMADQLIKIAASRHLAAGVRMDTPEGLFDDFSSRFPYAETEEQKAAIDSVVDDLTSGRNMDRLICGDVGFGKTEVALRAAFHAVMAGFQVAVVVPTTLLARQHYLTFKERFRGFPVNVNQLSRLVTGQAASRVKAGLADGATDIVVGTHALLAKGIKFKQLGLLVVDEEQHFGVGHKEKLKALKANVHVLTLTATPIPRTLQMALVGVRDLSLITTPPIDRVAVRTFVTPHDPVVIREALMRERYRGGQSFYVCPRISDIDGIATTLEKLVPELKVAVAHGRLSPKELEEVMTAFTDGRFDILLSTNIIESGLDIPRANTLIMHRADMFGLAQMYQLRGRVGRSKIRAYAYLTLPPGKQLTKSAQRRLEVMHRLDTLGAGFTLASHDLDIRGAGNLLGEEQSGHIKEVGVELYQQMLEEAVAAARSAEGAEAQTTDTWSPLINLGMPILIPESYVSDLGGRLGLYRRLAELTTRQEVDAFAAEMVDRFGALPDEVENLIRVVVLKQACRRAGIEKLDVGPKGAVVAFRNNQVANPAGLVSFISEQSGTAKLRPDHRLVFTRNWDAMDRRVAGAGQLVETLAAIAEHTG